MRRTGESSCPEREICPCSDYGEFPRSLEILRMNLLRGRWASAFLSLSKFTVSLRISTISRLMIVALFIATSTSLSLVIRELYFFVIF